MFGLWNKLDECWFRLYDVVLSYDTVEQADRAREVCFGSLQDQFEVKEIK